MGFGTNIKNMRKKQKMTLQELSSQSNVSVSMLSQIEREEKNPTLQVACQIAESLHTTLSFLIEEQLQKETITIRKKERLIYRDEQSGFERHLLSPSLPSKGVEFILNVVPPFKESGTFPSHKKGVKEYIFVAKGTLRVELGNGVCSEELKEGDSFYFEGDIEHRFINEREEECHYYLVIDSHESSF
ncbi:helix-turn-helix domain-containing protein [Priestia endophytica]|uniref:helix-turn-helix domain-containing protein n=1 Tax=Priestia endophytica TaxID=135735 RepID=UPI00124BDF69|nr:XRE family transcriptional regulator [Priestia endophytica]KAB2492826.1 helix-turn-helix domain-containing protein [Priestia endophytica]